LHEIQTAENCQTEKRGRNEIVTAAKIRLTNQMVLIVNFDCMFVFPCQIDDFMWFSRVCSQALTLGGICQKDRQTNTLGTAKFLNTDTFLLIKIAWC